jgi:hypothetical protein
MHINRYFNQLNPTGAIAKMLKIVFKAKRFGRLHNSHIVGLIIGG